MMQHEISTSKLFIDFCNVCKNNINSNCKIHKQCTYDGATQPSQFEVKEIVNDPVNHPSHYTQGKVECIEAMEASSTPEQFVGYLKNAVMKYIWRVGLKDDSLQDIKKAQWYLNKLINFMEKNK